MTSRVTVKQICLVIRHQKTHKLAVISLWLSQPWDQYVTVLRRVDTPYILQRSERRQKGTFVLYSSVSDCIATAGNCFHIRHGKLHGRWYPCSVTILPFRKNCYCRWNLGPLPPIGNQESEQGMAPYFLTKTEKIPRTTSARKVMLTLFWDERGVILEHYMPRGNTVTSTTYADLLKNHLHPAVKPKRRGLLSTGVLLQHDNARLHTACSIIATIQDLSFKCLPHLPYSSQVIFTSLDHSKRQVFQVWRGGARVVTLSAKRLFS